jgi:uncharacterized protein (TIGR03083 family)
MSEGINALRADREALLSICAGLGDAEWKAGSGCPGWSVQDVVAHMGALFQVVVDPAALPDVTGVPTERAQEVWVSARRALTPEQIVAHYTDVSEKAIGLLAGLAGADFEMPLGDLGTYPARVLPAAYCFDHYTHIRADLFAPRGPLPGPPPPSDELRLGPAVDWIEAAVGQQNAGRLAELAGAAEIVLSGGDSRTIRLGPDGPPVASVRSDADAFVRWVTQRAAWDELGVEAAGDERALGVLRALKVF